MRAGDVIDLQAARGVVSPAECGMFVSAKNFPTVRCPEEDDFSRVWMEAIPLQGTQVSLFRLKVVESQWNAAAKELVAGTLRNAYAAKPEFAPVLHLFPGFSPQVNQMLVSDLLYEGVGFA